MCTAPCDTSFKMRRIEISLLTYLLTYCLNYISYVKCVEFTHTHTHTHTLPTCHNRETYARMLTSNATNSSEINRSLTLATKEF